MKKHNCWQYKKCGRELGGSQAYEIGVCPAATNVLFDGIHDGINAGRSCWIIPETMCNGEIQGDFEQKAKVCGPCNFYTQLKNEEGQNITPTVELLKILEKNI